MPVQIESKFSQTNYQSRGSQGWKPKKRTQGVEEDWGQSFSALREEADTEVE